MLDLTKQPPQIPLIAPLSNRDTSLATDPKMVNCFVESGRMAVKRSGLSLYQQNAAGPGQGMYNYQDDLYSICGDTFNLNKAVTSGFTQSSTGAGFAPRVGAAAVGFLGKLWVINGTANVNGADVYYNDVYSSLDGKAWNKVLGNAPWAPRAGSRAIVFNNTLYMMGGSDSVNNYSDVWYTTDGVSWNVAAFFAWPSRKDFGLTIFNNKMWVAGGRAVQTDDFGNQTGYYNDVWSTTDGFSWTQVNANASWLPRSKFGFAAFNGKLIVLGGELSTYWQGAAGDLWSSIDGITWTRDSSNPFNQGASSVFSLAVLTSVPTGFWSPPSGVTISGGGGSGATGFVNLFQPDEEDVDDTGFLVTGVTIGTGGTGYTSAPSISFTNATGNNLAAYTMLAAQGAAGDKRGTFAQVGSTLYFFATLNNGTFSNEMWQSTDGKSWSLLNGSVAWGPRETTVISYGPFWSFGGQNTTGYLNDVWSGNLSASSSLPLSVISPGLPFSFVQTSVSLASPLIFFKTTADAFAFNPGTATVSKVSGGGTNFPPTTVPGAAYIDGYFLVMDPGGNVYNSAINDPTTWTALGVIKAQGEPNAGVALSKIGNYAVAFGVWSTTFFYDAAQPAPSSPLLPNDTYTSVVGCASGYSVVEMQNTILWIGQSKKGTRGIYWLNSLAPERISNPFVDRLVQADDLSDVRAYATEMSGHAIYVLTLVRSNVTLAFDFETKEWALWTSRQPAATIVIQSLTCNAYGLVTASATNHGLSDGDPITIATASIDGYNGPTNVNVIDANTFTYQVAGSQLAAASGVAQAIRTTEGYFYCRASAQAKGQNYLQHETNGNIFRFSPDALTDFGNPIDVRIITHNWDGGNRGLYKFLGTVDLVADTVSSSALLRYTKDDYRTWSVYRIMNLALDRVRTNRLGRFHKIAFQLRHTAATRFRAQLLELTIEGGS